MITEGKWIEFQVGPKRSIISCIFGCLGGSKSPEELCARGPHVLNSAIIQPLSRSRPPPALFRGKKKTKNREREKYGKKKKDLATAFPFSLPSLSFLSLSSLSPLSLLSLFRDATYHHHIHTRTHNIFPLSLEKEEQIEHGPKVLSLFRCDDGRRVRRRNPRCGTHEEVGEPAR